MSRRRFVRRLIDRSPLLRLLAGRSRKSSRRQRFARRLRCEVFEPRRLMAADAFVFHHNAFDPEDVNDDGLVSAIDALAIVNSMNRRDSADGERMFTDVNNDGQQSPIDALLVVNRINRGDRRSTRDTNPDTAPEANTDEFRSLDGTGNNLESPELGSAGQPLLRVASADYADGISSPAGEDRPSAREISNVLFGGDSLSTTNDRDLSAFIYVWGQFLDHDIDLTETQDSAGESFPIAVPTGDEYFDPLGTGEQTIPLTRSEYDPSTGTDVDNPRQQLSAITAWIDGSMIYGSDIETSDALREFSGGRLLLSDDGLLPTDEFGFFLAGDTRVNENVELTSMHTLFAREHNYWADRIAAENPQLEDEEIFQQARAIVIAEIQSITFNEFLPALLGDHAISRYQGYDPTVDPTIANEFSTAAYRFGHSTVNDDVEFFGDDGRQVHDEVSLAEAFFNPDLLRETGIDSILKYVASSESQEIDLSVVDSLRNFLFGEPGQGGLDLVALNIQRGRDHGLADYNSVRVAYGLDPVSSFADISSDTQVQADLESLYGDVDNIDLWVGILAEDHIRGGSLGELGTTIIADQFERLRDADRFWYENIFSGSELRELQNTQLSDIIVRNTELTNVQDDVFSMRAVVSGTVSIDLSDTRQRRGQSSRSTLTGQAGVEVELLNADGEVIDTTVTNSRGQYRFENFTETGDYRVQLAASNSFSAVGDDALDVLVSHGNTRLRGLNFVVQRT